MIQLTCQCNTQLPEDVTGTSSQDGVCDNLYLTMVGVYCAVMSLLWTQIMSHVDFHFCTSLSVVKFQSVNCCSLFKDKGYSWVNCRVCTVDYDVMGL